MEKAVRHFYDGYLKYQKYSYSYLLRTVRNDIDGQKNKIKRFIWMIINNSFWNKFLWTISLIY